MLEDYEAEAMTKQNGNGKPINKKISVLKSISNSQATLQVHTAAKEADKPHKSGAVSLRVQSILYGNEKEALETALESLSRAAELAIFEGICSRVDVAYGDCSPERILSEQDAASIKDRFLPNFNFSYRFFGENLGSARGHNELGLKAKEDFLLIQNPDVVVSPRLFERILQPFEHQNVGMVEAKQLPIEHPKDYDVSTGETGWATTACAAIPSPLFKQIGGFDADTFFLYCDDVDFSWLVRERGLKVIFHPAAVVFHHKLLTKSGTWQPSASERYYSAEAALLITHKWSRSDLTKSYLGFFQDHGDDYQKKAALVFQKRQKDGRLPDARDPDHLIAEFDGIYYTRHRFPL
jgi:GT2 family glycosyltransferase